MSEKFLMRLAKSIGDKYLQLGIFLGLLESDIQQIRADSDSVISCIFQILTTWKKRKTNADSLKVFTELCDAFTEFGRADLAGLITRGE